MTASRNEKMFFTRKSVALRSILLMTRLPSATTLGIAQKIRAQQNDVTDLAGRVASGGHGDGAVRLLERDARR
jgi:hypothetical protein